MKRIINHFKWSQWKDLSIGAFDHKPYLLQGKRNGNGRIKFRVASTFKTAWYCSAIKIEDLPILTTQ